MGIVVYRVNKGLGIRSLGFRVGVYNRHMVYFI